MNDDFLIGREQVLARVGIGRTKLNEELRNPKSDFPRPITTNGGRGGRRLFSNAEISEYIERRLASRFEPKPPQREIARGRR